MHNAKASPSRVASGLQSGEPDLQVTAIIRTVVVAAIQTGQRKFIQNPRGGIRRAVINRNNLEIGIVKGRECSQRSRQLFFLIASRKQQRNPRALRIPRQRRKIFNPWQAHQSLRHAQPMKNPENRNNPKERKPKPMNVVFLGEYHGEVGV